jgi:hypothetical protein
MLDLHSLTDRQQEGEMFDVDRCLTLILARITSEVSLPFHWVLRSSNLFII